MWNVEADKPVAAGDSVIAHAGAFARGFAPKLVDDGLISAERAEQALNALTEAETGAGTRMITPVVLEIVARRR